MKRRILSIIGLAFSLIIISMIIIWVSGTLNQENGLMKLGISSDEITRIDTLLGSSGYYYIMEDKTQVQQLFSILNSLHYTSRTPVNKKEEIKNGIKYQMSFYKTDNTIERLYYSPVDRTITTLNYHYVIKENIEDSLVRWLSTNEIRIDKDWLLHTNKIKLIRQPQDETCQIDDKQKISSFYEIIDHLVYSERISKAESFERGYLKPGAEYSITLYIGEDNVEKQLCYSITDSALGIDSMVYVLNKNISDLLDQWIEG